MDKHVDPTEQLWNIARSSVEVDQRSWVNVSTWVPSHNQIVKEQLVFEKPTVLPAPEFVRDTRFDKIKD